MNIPRKCRKTLPKKVLCVFAFGLICSFIGSGYASAKPHLNSNVMEQQQAKVTVQGKIIDEKGEALIGVSVVARGTTQGTITDIDGKYTINTTPDATLVFSYVGFHPQSIAVGSRKTIDIVMKEDSQLMQEVVVVGFGVQKKENLTGAVTSVDVGKTLDSRPIPDVGRGLQGAVPGLSVTIPNGEVGSDPVMKIRGQVGSLTGGSAPLILVDNVEIPSIQMINANDIASISVLKDAASTSIYGAKGAFGVILITTKQGAKEESVVVEYSNNISWQKTSKNINMGGIDAVEYSVLAAERIGNTKSGAFWLADRTSFERSKQWIEKYSGKVGANDPMVYGRDWYMDGASKMGVRLYDSYDYMIEEWTPAQAHNLSLNGKSGSVSYNIGLGYLNQSGMMKPADKDDFTRYNATIRLSSKINKYVTVRGGVLYSDRRKRYPYATNSTTADAWYYVYRWGPLSPFGTENGDPIRSAAFELENSNTAEQSYGYTNINIGATITLSKDWTLDADYTFANQDMSWNKPGTRFTARNSWGGAVARNDENGNRIYVNNEGNIVPEGSADAMPAYELPYVTYTGRGANPDHIYREAENYRQSTSNVFTTYNLKLNDDHNFKFMAGLNWVKSKNVSNWSQKTDLFDITNPQFTLANGTQTAGGKTLWESQLGYFGRINYMLMGKYLLEGNLRYDGSSKFPNDLKWRWFPSFSAGWIVTNESFMEELNPTLSFLKLRGSWGSIGDQSVPNNLYVPLMNSFTSWASPAYQWINGANKVQGYSTPLAADANITWQDIENLNLGFDLRLFKDKLGITYDWYQRTTKSMITQGIDLPYTFGGPVPRGNYGELRTRGWEIAVDFNHRFSNGIGINFLATLSDATSMITDYPDEATKNVKDYYANYKGKRWGDIYGYRTDRLYQESDFNRVTVDGKEVWQLKEGNPNQVYLQNSSNFVFGPGDVKFVDLNGDGKIDDGSGVVGDSGDLEVIGNTTPRYEYGFRLGADYKGIDFSIFFQGVGKRQIWGNGLLAIPGYNAGDGAMPQTIAGDFWKEDRTDAFYPRPYNMAASAINLNNMQVQSRYLLDMAYLRIKNITVGYTLSPELIKKAYLRNARIYMSIENFFTFDNLRGLPIDPEVVSGFSMFNESNYNSGRTGVGTPMFKSLSFGVQLTF
ncbi:SusC/RagA family TonB-linked outer membrane protein [Dysgonomonas sp. ZJ279]|uniref:SusC/RagA family TonB-linked outer membrane protein n=1 Tax=Dysgonomonas sp. ZJ279 TaxID=2709796 RepID=UPI00162576DE|nr:TonB-dependent receptor [Dysgonomonas sp. ZJ279]